MKTGTWAFLIGLVAVVGVVAAFATGGADEASDETADNVFLGELDLAERMEIWRNQYRRMTPGDEPLVQDVGTWPAAWEEFGRAWDAAPAERDLATWLVPVTAERSGGLTVLRDANGNALWSGQTDFAKDESAGVTITGALVDEEDWALYEAAREEVGRRWAEAARPVFPRMRGTNGPITNGLRFTDISVDTNGDYKLDFAWETDGDVQVFCRAMHYECWTNFGVVTTNDENQVVTNDVVNWRQVPGEKFMGIPDYWVSLGVTNLTNGEGSFTDTDHADPLFDRVRFYAAAAFADSDNDGITDGEEWLWGISSPTDDSDGDGVPDYLERTLYHTDPYNPDTDGDGWTDGEEVNAQTDPLDRLSATRLARGVLVHGVKYSGDETNQWVQLHCSGPRRVDVSGFRVQAAGTSWQTVATLPAGTWMTPGHFLLIGDEGVTNADLTAALGLAGSEPGQPTAGVRLMAPAGSTNDPVDVMFYGRTAFNTQGLDTFGWQSSTTSLWASVTRRLERWNLGVDTDSENDWRHIADGDVFNADAILDFDGDGLTDEEEYVSGYNPLNQDMDGDGLFDGYEILASLNPQADDSDNDGVKDGEEYNADTGSSNWNSQMGDGISVEYHASKGTWHLGESIGSFETVAFDLAGEPGAWVWATIAEGGDTSEPFSASVRAGSVGFAETNWVNWFKRVNFLLELDENGECEVLVADLGHTNGVSSSNSFGSDITASFQLVHLDISMAYTTEATEENPGEFLADSLVHDDAMRTTLSVAPCRMYGFPGHLELTWGTTVAMYNWINPSAPIAQYRVPVASAKGDVLYVEGQNQGFTDIIWKSTRFPFVKDRIRATSVSVSMEDIERVVPGDGNERELTMTLSPSPIPNGASLGIEIVRISGDEGYASLDEPSSGLMSQTGTVRILGEEQSWGTGASPAPNNMELCVMLPGHADPMAVFPFTVCAHPANFRELAKEPLFSQYGYRYYYMWDSDSGIKSHLNKVWVGEKVTYGDGGIHVGANRPWKANNPNPTIRPPLGTLNGNGLLQDDHLPPGGLPDAGPDDSYTATQYYGFRCMRCGTGTKGVPSQESLEPLLGPLPSHRMQKWRCGT